MPTATDYETAARLFISVHGRLPTLLTQVETHLPSVVGGRLRGFLDQAVAQSVRQVAEGRDRLEEVAEVCAARAAHIRELEAIQRAFDADYARYLEANEVWLDAATAFEAAPHDGSPPGPMPRRPPDPQPVPEWAELVL